MMLRHLGLMNEADTIENALLRTLELGNHTGDFGDRSKPSLSTTDFANTIIANLGKAPAEGVSRKSNIASSFHLPQKPAKQRMMLGSNRQEEQIVGLDVFFQSAETGEELAQKLIPLNKNGLKLIMISNRGTQVWPTGSIYTECVDQYRARFEMENGLLSSLQEMLQFSVQLGAIINISSIEILRNYGGKAAYSLAQGQ
jgi:isocitrate dehydrogenase